MQADDQVAPDRSSYGSLNGRLRRLLYGFQHFGEYALHRRRELSLLSEPDQCGSVSVDILRISDENTAVKVFYHPLDHGQRQDQSQNKTQAVAERKSLFLTVLLAATLGETV